jgi:hypothetical protein
VRGDLASIDGITEIQTELFDQTVSFKLSDWRVDYASHLKELASANPHLAGYTIQSAVWLLPKAEETSIPDSDGPTANLPSQ